MGTGQEGTEERKESLGLGAPQKTESETRAGTQVVNLGSSLGTGGRDWEEWPEEGGRAIPGGMLPLWSPWRLSGTWSCWLPLRSTTAGATELST